MAIYLKNVNYIDWQTLRFTNGNLKVEEGENGGIQFIDNCPHGAFDVAGKLVTKSFVCAHHHAYSALARGMPAPETEPQNFHQKLQYIWWHLDKNLDQEMIRASALITALDCVKKGVTFVIDHHSSPNAIPGSLFIIAEAFEKVGINHLLCYEMSDRDGQACRERGLKESENYLAERPGLVGLHASFTVGDQLMKSAVALSEKYNSGIHIHVAEDQIDQTLCLRDHQMRVIERLHKFAVLDFPKTILAHCIHLNENERKLLSVSKAWIALNTESNLNNQVGLFSNLGGLESQALLGTDGMHCDMIRSAQFNFFAGKAIDALSLNDFYQRFIRAHKYLKVNDIPGDTDNNLVILNYHSPTPVTAENWLGHFFYGLTAADADGVISNGKWLLRDKHLVDIDQKEMLNFAQEQANRLWRKLV